LYSVSVVGFPFAKLSTKTLYMKVLDYDRFSRDDPIGEVCIPLCDVDLANGETLCRNLQTCKGHAVSLLFHYTVSPFSEPALCYINLRSHFTLFLTFSIFVQGCIFQQITAALLVPYQLVAQRPLASGNISQTVGKQFPIMGHNVVNPYLSPNNYSAMTLLC